jgi:DNA-binding FadR family transcriptional regulator
MLGETLIRPVSRATHPQEIVKALIDLIMKRVWKPGDLIPSEKELAIRFQVGRSTIREAVKSLVVLGVWKRVRVKARSFGSDLIGASCSAKAILTTPSTSAC